MTPPIEQLQQLGLNKYEAEAYYALLKYGPLTGYEVGKRSQVPLSRGYDVLERLVDKGLVLVQPGEPSRYNAREPEYFLGQVRSSMEATLEELSSALSAFSQDDEANDFWIVRGSKNILQRGQELIAAAQSQLKLSIPARYDGILVGELGSAHQRRVHILQPTLRASSTPEGIFILRDGHQVLLGTLAPAESCQAVISSNVALVTVVNAYFESAAEMQLIPAFPTSTSSEQAPQDAEWMDWETRKHARLRRLSNRVA